MSDADPPEPTPPAWRGPAQAVAVGLLTLLLCAWQAGRVGVTWDEACWYFAGARALDAWWAAGAPLDTFALSRALHGDWHPPGIKLLAWLAHALTPSAWPEWYRWRMGGPALLGVTTGLVFLAVRPRLGLLAAACAVGGLLAQPQLLAHASVMGTDAPLAACAVLALVSLAAAEDDRRWRVALHLALGGAILIKLSGLAVVGGAALSALALRNRRTLAHVGIAAGWGLLLLVLLYPAWELGDWFGHLGRLREHPIPVVFLGERMARPPLHWIAVTLVAVPPAGWLVMVLLGVGALLRARDRWALALLPPAGVWLLFFATPLAPRHDGARQIAFVCAVLGVAGGIGLARLATGLAARAGPRRAGPLSALALVLPLSGLVAWWRAQPYPLSCFSGLVGGLPGAARLGFEPTFYWDACTPATWRELNALLPPGARVSTLLTMGYVEEARRLGLARADLVEAWPEEATHLLVLRRTSLWTPDLEARRAATELVRAWSHPSAPEVPLLELRRRP